MPRWRRLDAAVERLSQAAVESDTEVPDSTVLVLDALNHLWEVWIRVQGIHKRWPEQNDAVAGDAAGETAVALIFARGGITHDLVEPGQRLGFGQQPFGTSPFGLATWYWSPYSDQRDGYKRRSDWYAARVAGQEVRRPLEAAYQWFSDQPDIAP